jgi:protein ImuB
MTDTSATRRFLALLFPTLSADRWRRQAKGSGAAPEAPLVFTHRRGNRIELAAVDRQAAALGLAPGLALADARARLPALLALPHDPVGDRALLERLAALALRHAPAVAPMPPDALLLDISGTAHLAGGEAPLAHAARAAIGALGIATAHAFAATPAAALALARFVGKPVPDEAAAVRALPVAALGLPPDSELALRRAGLTRVGDVAARPLASLAARFGADAVRALGRLTGDAQDPLAPVRLPPPLVFERRFPEPVARVDYMLHALAALCETGAGQLARRAEGGRRFEIQLFRSDGELQSLSVETGRPTRDPAVVMRLVGERLEALADPLDPGFGYDLLRLSVPRTEPLAAVQLPLADRADADDTLAALVDRLSARHGAGRWLRFHPRDSHLPEAAEARVPALHASPGAPGWATAPPGEPPLRPLLLFEPPQPIEVVAEVPDGPPWRFRWRRTLHQVARVEGPERIAPEWWRLGDGRLSGGLTRDYFRVEDQAGGRYWIFRRGLYGSEARAPAWYLHGLFA